MAVNKRIKNRSFNRNSAKVSLFNFNWRWLVKALFLTCFLSGLVIGYFKILDPSHFPVNKVLIVGEYNKITPQELKKVVLPHVAQGFFGFSVKEIKNDVEQIPWVQESMIYRRWPDQLVIEIKQQKPLAIWNDKGVISQQGELFYPPSKSVSTTLPHLFGPKNLFKEVQKGFLEMNKIIKPLGLSIVEVSMDQRHSWRAKLNNGIYLIIGQMDYRKTLHNFVKGYPKIIAGRAHEVNYIDLRYNNGMAVHWKDQTTFI